MPHINFVREFSAFMKYARDSKLPGNERNLWLALFYIMNDRAIGGNWPDQPVPIANQEMMLHSSLSEKTMGKARGRLKERCLIEYEPGVKNKKNPRYKLNYLTVPRNGYPQDYQQANECYPQNAPNIGGNMGGNARGNMGGINLNVNLNTERGNVSATAEATRAREECLRELVRDMPGSQQEYVRWFARMDASESTLIEYAEILKSGKYTRDQMREAMSLLEEKSDRERIDSPLRYLKKLLYDWEKHEIWTTADIEEYLAYSPEPSSPIGSMLNDAEKGGLY